MSASHTSKKEAPEPGNALPGHDLALQASYQIELMSELLRMAAVKEVDVDEEALDLITTSLAIRIKKLNSVVMSALGREKPFTFENAEDTVFGRRSEATEDA